MSKKVYLPILIVLLAACTGRTDIKPTADGMTIDVRTDVRTPRNADTDSIIGWILTAKAMIESEHRSYGDDVCLSAAYFVRNLLVESALYSYNGDGQAIDLQQGMSVSLIKLMSLYGAMPHDAYHAPKGTRYGPLARELDLTVATYRMSHAGGKQMAAKAEAMVDELTGPAPRSVHMLGCQYTPVEFAHSMCRDNEYTAIMSVDHHPYGRSYILESRYNRYKDTFLNLPADTMTNIAVKALAEGHVVCWDGTADGGLRSLLLVGLAHDGSGKRHIVAQDMASGDIAYLSVDCFKNRTVAITLATSCLPGWAWESDDGHEDIFVLPDSI